MSLPVVEFLHFVTGPRTRSLPSPLCIPWSESRSLVVTFLDTTSLLRSLLPPYAALSLVGTHEGSRVTSVVLLEGRNYNRIRARVLGRPLPARRGVSVLTDQGLTVTPFPSFAGRSLRSPPRGGGPRHCTSVSFESVRSDLPLVRWPSDTGGRGG